MEEIRKDVEQMDDVIVVDDGRVDVPIKNQYGEVVGTFRFNPTDINIVNRYNEAAAKFEDIAKPLIDYDIDGNGEGKTKDAVEALNEAEDKMIELMDYVFDADSRESFFSKIHAFAPTNGKFYCEVVYTGIGNYISKKFDAETKAVSIRVDKYTHGYKTGKHAKGWQ